MGSISVGSIPAAAEKLSRPSFWRCSASPAQATRAAQRSASRENRSQERCPAGGARGYAASTAAQVGRPDAHAQQAAPMLAHLRAGPCPPLQPRPGGSCPGAGPPRPPPLPARCRHPLAVPHHERRRPPPGQQPAGWRAPWMRRAGRGPAAEQTAGAGGGRRQRWRRPRLRCRRCRRLPPAGTGTQPQTDARCHRPSSLHQPGAPGTAQVEGTGAAVEGWQLLALVPFTARSSASSKRRRGLSSRISARRPPGRQR